MRHKYKKQLEKKMSSQTESTNYSLVEYNNKADRNAKPRHLETQNVRLHFLTERPYREYLSRNTEPLELNSSMEMTRSEDKSKSLVVYEEESANEASQLPTYPPLTINALMEYRPLLKAPGAGEFDHGKPRFFKPA